MTRVTGARSRRTLPALTLAVVGLLGVLDEAAYALDHEVAPREVVGGMVDIAQRRPQVLTSGVQLCLGAAQRPLVDGDRPHGDLLPRWTPVKPEVVKL